jgi:hypothetical protein
MARPVYTQFRKHHGFRHLRFVPGSDMREDLLLISAQANVMKLFTRNSDADFAKSPET